MTKPEIDNYFINEILNGFDFDRNLGDKNALYEFYGSPKDEIIEIDEHGRNIIEKNGGMDNVYINGNRWPIGIRKIIYDDLIHVFSIFESGFERYSSVEINKPLERLKTINIGDNVIKIKEVFGDGNNRGSDSDSIIYFGINNSRAIIFYIENDIIIKIECIYFFYE